MGVRVSQGPSNPRIQLSSLLACSAMVLVLLACTRTRLFSMGYGSASLTRLARCSVNVKAACHEIGLASSSATLSVLDV
jgi:hypothetical protein